jgi:hypothetical protein
MELGDNTVDALSLAVKIIKARLKLYNQKYQQTGSNPNCQSQGINQSIGLVAFKVPERGFEIIADHGSLTIRIVIRTRFIRP